MRELYMPTLVEINGLDESGRVGDNLLFVRVAVHIHSELQLILRNLSHFEKLIIRKEDLKGREEKNLMAYVRDMIDDPVFSIAIYRMRPNVQVQLMKRYLSFLWNDLFKTRGALLETLQKSVEEKELDKTASSQRTISSIIENFQRFENSEFAIESMIKSYGMMKVTKRLDTVSELFRTPTGPDVHLYLVVQIDGGYPFAFWWKTLLESEHIQNLKKQTYIAGVGQGDGYYPAISAAGAIAQILHHYPNRNYFFPIYELNYDERFPVDESFYYGHSVALNRPTFNNRIVFLGQIEANLRNCIPYFLHRADRKKTYEAFGPVEKTAENFFKNFGHGNKENTIIVCGALSSWQDKVNLKYCEDRGYDCKHVPDIRPQFEALIQEIGAEIDLLPKEKRTKLAGTLKTIEESCSSSFK
jgi:hypothetical protein